MKTITQNFTHLVEPTDVIFHRSYKGRVSSSVCVHYEISS